MYGNRDCNEFIFKLFTSEIYSCLGPCLTTTFSMFYSSDILIITDATFRGICRVFYFSQFWFFFNKETPPKFVFYLLGLVFKSHYVIIGGIFVKVTPISLIKSISCLCWFHYACFLNISDLSEVSSKVCSMDMKKPQNNLNPI